MGQYYLTVNLDKREYLDPHKLGDGLKLLEFGTSSNGTLTALAILLADGNNRGGGDLRSDHPIIGSWAGDRIVIAGDYADTGKFIGENELGTYILDGCIEKHNLYSLAEDQFRDVSLDVARAMCDDSYLKQDLMKKQAWNGDSKSSVYDLAMQQQ